MHTMTSFDTERRRTFSKRQTGAYFPGALSWTHPIAFKDMALSTYSSFSYELTAGKDKNHAGQGERLELNTASSGDDTGKAAMAGFAEVSVEHRIIRVFYPKGLVVKQGPGAAVCATQKR